MTLAPVLSRYWDQPNSWTLDSYLRHDATKPYAKR